MLSILFVTILVLEVALGCWLDIKMYGTALTPFSALAMPYVAVVLLAWMFAGSLSLSPIYAPSLLVWIVGLALVWVTTTSVAWGALGAGIPNGGDQKSTRTAFEQSIRTPTISLAWFLIPIMFAGLWIDLRSIGGWDQLGSPEFRDVYMYGWPAHARLLSVPTLILLIGTYRKGDRRSAVTIGILMLVLLLAQVKGALLEPVLGGVIYRACTGRLRINLSKALATVAGGYIAFNLVYLLAMWTINPESVWDSTAYSVLFRHFFFYLFAGVLAFGEALKSSISFADSSRLLFAPFINVAHVVYGSGPLLAAGTPKALGMTIDLLNPDPIEASNVFTIFGTLYLYIGPLLGSLYVIAMSGVLSFVFCFARRSCNPWWTVALSYVLAQFIFGFFELYFWYSAVFEVSLYCALLGLWSFWSNRPPTATQHLDSLAEI